MILSHISMCHRLELMKWGSVQLCPFTLMRKHQISVTDVADPADNRAYCAFQTLTHCFSLAVGRLKSNNLMTAESEYQQNADLITLSAY